MFGCGETGGDMRKCWGRYGKVGWGMGGGEMWEVLGRCGEVLGEV